MPFAAVPKCITHRMARRLALLVLDVDGDGIPLPGYWCNREVGRCYDLGVSCLGTRCGGPGDCPDATETCDPDRGVCVGAGRRCRRRGRQPVLQGRRWRCPGGGCQPGDEPGQSCPRGGRHGQGPGMGGRPGSQSSSAPTTTT